MSRTTLCLVQKSAPATKVEDVGSDHYAALREYFKSGKDSVYLTHYLDSVHASNRWILCDCVGGSVPLEQRPALTVARSPKGRLFLRNLRSRMAHAQHCPFAYEPGVSVPKEDGAAKKAPPSDLLKGVLNLHRGEATGVGGASVDPGERRSSTSRSQYPRLGQVLLHLMKEAGMLAQGPKFDFLESINLMRQSAAEMSAFDSTTLDEVLCLSARQERDLMHKVSDLRHRVSNAYGVMIVVAHAIEQRPTRFVRYGRKPGEIEWSCQPAGEVKIWSRRSINKGPFIVALTYAPSPGEKEVKAQHAFALPILSNGRPLPVESDLERTVASSLTRLMEWAKEKRKDQLELIKPMYDIEVPSGQCRPDFIVKGQSNVIVEVMGMLKDEEYRERKERTVPLMQEFADVYEIGSLPTGSEESKEELWKMNKWVYNTVRTPRDNRNIW